MTTGLDWAGIITAIGALIGAIGGVYSIWTKFHQDEKNKMTDLKIEQYRKQEKKRGFRRAENTGKVLGELSQVLISTGADRVYIVQPHPLGHIAFLSIQFEVKARGVQGMRMEVQKLEMSEVPQFSKMMAEKLFMYFDDIDNQIEDRVAKSLLSSNGTVVAAVKRLKSSRDWVGSIFCEFMEQPKIPVEDLKIILHEAATNIQFNLPEFQEED
jgi:hypothetical protein